MSTFSVYVTPGISQASLDDLLEIRNRSAESASLAEQEKNQAQLAAQEAKLHSSQTALAVQEAEQHGGQAALSAEQAEQFKDSSELAAQAAVQHSDQAALSAEQAKQFRDEAKLASEEAEHAGGGVFSADERGNIYAGEDAFISNHIEMEPDDYGYITPPGGNNFAAGRRALKLNRAGGWNVAIGSRSLESNIGGGWNVAIGDSSLRNNIGGGWNVAIGNTALELSAEGAWNVAVGDGAMRRNKEGSYNIAIGGRALERNDSGERNIALGENAMRYSKKSQSNVSIGDRSMEDIENGINNIGIGYNSLINIKDGEENIGIGSSSLERVSDGLNNICLGNKSGRGITGSIDREIWVYTGSYNVSLGAETLNGSGLANYCTALGYRALYNSGKYDTWDNMVALGYKAEVTGSNQVQLGNADTTVYCYGAVQNRSDARDKADVRNTALGLSFIEGLRPVDFKWDLRESYRAPLPKELESQPTEPNEDASAEEKNLYAVQLNEWKDKHNKWLRSQKLETIQPDGSKKRSRYHHGLIAQEVKQVMDEMGVDFGGYQDHSINGGDDVLSIGYEELIAPLIAAVQELSQRVKNLEKAP